MGIESNNSVLTRVNYARDLIIFFDFLKTNIVEFKKEKIMLCDMENLTATHIEKFLNHLNYYVNNNKELTNSSKTKRRKLSTVRAMLKYFFNKDKLSSNVASKVKTPKIKDKEIIRLEIDEVVKILNEAEIGNDLTKQQRTFHFKTSKRDFALLSLFLGTGIRISECVGLNVNDIDFASNAFTITRKGGQRVILYFSSEVENALKSYIEERKQAKNFENTAPLFLSLQNKRINVRTVELLVKKYAKIISPLKHITPHKLRSTYGTSLYRETGDIYIVAEVLGHKDVNTTKKYYAAISEDMRRAVANKVKLRDDK